MAQKQRYWRRKDPFADMMKITTDVTKFTVGTVAVTGVAAKTLDVLRRKA